MIRTGTVVSILVAFLLAFLLLGGFETGDRSGGEENAATRSVRPRAFPPGLWAKPISREALLEKLHRAGLETRPVEEVRVDPDDLLRFPRKPEVLYSIRVSDARGNAEVMTLIELRNAEEAASIRRVNGFPVRNWFFLGSISNRFRNKVMEAVG